MAEILVKAVDTTHADPDKDRRGCYKRGMCVVVQPDGHAWGAKEQLPRFVVIKVPGIETERVRKYIDAQLDGLGEQYRRRLWQIRWADLPLAARNKLAAGGLTIKATEAYTGAYDYTWAQIKGFFRNLLTNQDETEDL